MRLKSFFSDSIETAIARARQEMGPEAMLVNSKRTSAEGRHLGAYEVVVCAEDENPPGIDKRSAPGSPPSDPASMKRLSQDVSELRQQMERLALALARSGGAVPPTGDPESSALVSRLAEAELDMNLVYGIIGRIGSPPAASAVRAELRRMVRVDAELGPAGAGGAVALVGPPGSGKTSALVKLAVQYGIAARRPTLILSLDTYRIAASDELRSYAAILGIACQILDTTAALAQALEEHREKKLVLIDTPGLCRNEMEACHDLAQYLASDSAVDTHLVLPASMRAADLHRVAGHYAVFQPKKLLFTRLDETEIFGPLISQSARWGIPISFLCRGQRIPEDLEPANPELMIDLIMGPESSQAPQIDRAAA